MTMMIIVITLSFPLSVAVFETSSLLLFFLPCCADIPMWSLLGSYVQEQQHPNSIATTTNCLFRMSNLSISIFHMEDPLPDLGIRLDILCFWALKVVWHTWTDSSQYARSWVLMDVKSATSLVYICFGDRCTNEVIVSNDIHASGGVLIISLFLLSQSFSKPIRGCRWVTFWGRKRIFEPWLGAHAQLRRFIYRERNKWNIRIGTCGTYRILSHF